MLDVTPLSLGIAKLGEFMSVILPKNESIPCMAEKTYYSVADGQTEAKVEIFEGERELVKDCHRLGGFTITGVQPLPAG